jgi:hypothetical protein
MSTRRTSTPVPYDEDAEAALIGGALVWPDHVEALAADVAPEVFYRPRHQALWQVVLGLIAEGVKPDAVVVLDRVRRLGADLEEADLLALMSNALPPQRAHTEIILRHAAARQVLHGADELRQGIVDGADPYALATQGAAAFDEVGSSAAGGEPEAMTMAELIASADESAPWVIPGLLRRDMRVVIVAAEGAGKSVLLRQIGVCAAQGVHPLRCDAMPPVRVLVVDGENSRQAIVETGARLDAQARRTSGDTYDPERLRVWSRPGGLDLRTPRDRAAFVRELRHQRPQLVVAGPVYKLHRRRERESYEEAAEGLQQVLDDLRVRFGFALVLEHHAPKKDGGAAVRDLAPFGSQRWLAWPELGIGLYPERDGNGLRLRRFRGDRMASSWPDRIVRNEVWPFAGVWEHGTNGAPRGAGR